MLRLEDVHAFYGNAEALRGVNIEVGQGEIACMIGNNGAGKSTALMAISGIVKPRTGRILFEDRVISHLPSHEIVKLGISQVPEGRRIFPRLTVRENLEMGAFLHSRDMHVNCGRVYSLFPILKERERQLGGTLSGGEQQMLAIGRALMSSPKMLLLDEPSLGLAPIIVSKIFKTIREINEQGVTILLVEQNARAALKLSRKGYVLESGRIHVRGSGVELLEQEEVRKAYLGE
ncbi:MAG TPA: ABC transporter ATP-binding protein [Thermodesulfovibrionales bacterium]|nr:ABC transporter ATP-binding protein [Thermodesulfovibrionales bacterium]